MQKDNKRFVPGGENVISGNFGPLPAGSTILWQTDHFIIYADSKGKIWRFMHEFHARWPVEFDPPIKIPIPDPPFKRVLTQKELEELI
jgi:hypothetical protein